MCQGVTADRSERVCIKSDAMICSDVGVHVCHRLFTLLGGSWVAVTVLVYLFYHDASDRKQKHQNNGHYSVLVQSPRRSASVDNSLVLFAGFRGFVFVFFMFSCQSSQVFVYKSQKLEFLLCIYVFEVFLALLTSFDGQLFPCGAFAFADEPSSQKGVYDLPRI